MTAPKFSLGQLLATPSALEALQESGQTPAFFIDQHMQGHWGDVDCEDWKANELALVDGSRILSSYRTLKGTRIWVITECQDDLGSRSVTTILLPEDY